MENFLGFGYYGIVGLIIFILDIWAIVVTITSNRDAVTKLMWVLIILILPLVGLILWWLLEYRKRVI